MFELPSLSLCLDVRPRCPWGCKGIFIWPPWPPSMPLVTLHICNCTSKQLKGQILLYSPVRLRLNGRVTRFTFSAAISKSLELKMSLIALYKAQSNSKKPQQSKFEKLHLQFVKTGLNKKGLFHSNQFWHPDSQRILQGLSNEISFVF